MAYNQEEEYNKMIAAVQADPVLSDYYVGQTGELISGLISKVSIANKTAADSFDSLLKQIEDESRNRDAHTLSWCVDRVQEFRWVTAENRGANYTRNALGNFVEYIEDGDLIVSAASGVEAYGVGTLLVASGQIGGLSALTMDQLLAIQTYCKDRVRGMGSRIIVDSRPPDSVKVSGTIYVDALRGINNVASSVISSLTNYVNKDIPFNGLLNFNKIIDVMQNVPGVVDVDSILLQSKPANQQTFRNVQRQTSLYSGYATYVGTSNLFTIIPA